MLTGALVPDAAKVGDRWFAGKCSTLWPTPISPQPYSNSLTKMMKILDFLGIILEATEKSNQVESHGESGLRSGL